MDDLVVDLRGSKPSFRARTITRTIDDLESIRSYVPRMVIQQYLDNPNLQTPADAKPDSFPAAVLFADISGWYTVLLCDTVGFTMLNERYAKEPGGVEKVTRYVNAYFKVIGFC